MESLQKMPGVDHKILDQAVQRSVWVFFCWFGLKTVRPEILKRCDLGLTSEDSLLDLGWSVASWEAFHLGSSYGVWVAENYPVVLPSSFWSHVVDARENSIYLEDFGTNEKKNSGDLEKYWNPQIHRELCQQDMFDDVGQYNFWFDGLGWDVKPHHLFGFSSSLSIWNASNSAFWPEKPWTCIFTSKKGEQSFELGLYWIVRENITLLFSNHVGSFWRVPLTSI